MLGLIKLGGWLSIAGGAVSFIIILSFTQADTNRAVARHLGLPPTGMTLDAGAAFGFGLASLLVALIWAAVFFAIAEVLENSRKLKVALLPAEDENEAL